MQSYRGRDAVFAEPMQWQSATQQEHDWLIRDHVIDNDVTAVGSMKPNKRFDQRAFACACFADECDVLSAFNG